MLYKKLLILISFISISSYSAVYQCKVDGKVIFQQIPCGDEANEVKCDSKLDYSKIFHSSGATPEEKYCYRKAEELKKIRIQEAKKLEEVAAREKRLNPPKSIAQIRHEFLLDNAPTKAIASAVVDGLFYVEYFAFGGKMSATYTNQTGSTEQKELNGYWYKKMILPKGEHVYLSVQNQNEYGSVGIKIRVNGTVFKESNSNTDYGIASGDLLLSDKHIDFLLK